MECARGICKRERDTHIHTQRQRKTEGEREKEREIEGAGERGGRQKDSKQTNEQSDMERKRTGFKIDRSW